MHLSRVVFPQTVFERGSSSGSMYRPPSVSSAGSLDLGSGMRESPSLDSGIQSEFNYRQRSVTPIDSMNNSVNRWVVWWEYSCTQVRQMFLRLPESYW